MLQPYCYANITIGQFKRTYCTFNIVNGTLNTLMEKISYNRIKAALAEKGVSNKALAENVGVTEDTVSSWCVQRRQPSWENLYSIADYLKVDVRSLLVPNKKSPAKDFKF